MFLKESTDHYYIYYPVVIVFCYIHKYVHINEQLRWRYTNEPTQMIENGILLYVPLQAKITAPVQ